MKTPLNRLGRCGAAAFMAFALAAIAHGAVCVAAVPMPIASAVQAQEGWL